MNRKEEIYLKSRCPCKWCVGTRISDKLVDWILRFEKELGKETRITSGARCKNFNTSIGGYWDSPHLIDQNNIGHAIDFYIMDLKPIEIAFKLDKLNLGRIGIYRTHIHWDTKEPSPSRYWYIGTDGEPIYSKEIKDLKEFLFKIKQEGRLSKNDNDVLNNLFTGVGVFTSANKETQQKQKTTDKFKRYKVL